MTKLAISSLHPFCLCFKVGQHERHSDPSLTFHTVWRRVRLFHVHSSSATASRQARYSSRSPYSQSRCSHGAPRSTLLPRYSSCRKRSPTACLAHLQEHRLCNGWDAQTFLKSDMKQRVSLPFCSPIPSTGPASPKRSIFWPEMGDSRIWFCQFGGLPATRN